MNNDNKVAIAATPRFSTGQQILLTLAACAATTVLATPLLGAIDLANIVMLFLLTVLLIAVTLGRNAAIGASVLSVLLFDVFFVPPRFSLAVDNIQYLITFFVMLATALITGQLAGRLQQRAREALEKSTQTQALYDLARQLAGSLTAGQVNETVSGFIAQQFGARATLLWQGAEPVSLDPARSGPRLETHLAQIALDSGKPVRSDEIGELGYASLYLPLKGATRTRGVLAIAFETAQRAIENDEQPLFEALASLVVVALERLHYVDVAHSSEMNVQVERLRSSILSALSHDLRTPLTAMVGLADSLTLIKPLLPPVALESAQALHEQAERLAGLVGNLLDMARLNAGDIRLRREWQPLEEVIGASIKLLGIALSHHPVQVHLAPGLPLLEFDAVLIERVFCNLLENAAKYAPAGKPIELSAQRVGEMVEVAVRDHGPGFAPGQTQALFEMFVRGQSEGGQPGTGLGLAICRAVVDTHGGTIRAENAPDGGARVVFTLPCGNPPVLEEELP